jgi:hypothetical protein
MIKLFSDNNFKIFFENDSSNDLLLECILKSSIFNPILLLLLNKNNHI